MEAERRRQYLEVLGLKDWLAEASSPKQPPVGAGLARDRDLSKQHLPAVHGATVAAEQTPARPSVAGRSPAATRHRRVGSGSPRETIPTPASAREEPSEPAAPVVESRTFATLDEARTCVSECTACGLHTTRTQTVFGVGPDQAPLMVIGEGPGAEEDRRGEPFVGRAGKLLDQMLAAIGHSRTENCYIGNVVKCRPPNNRDPAPDEVAACRGYLDAQVALVRPKLILAVGRIAAQRLLDTSEPLSKLRGRVHHYGAGEVPVWVTYHPAYLLRSPREKGRAWEDLKRVHALLAEAGGGAGQ